MTRLITGSLLLLLASLFAFAQKPPQSDPQALDLAAKSIAVLTGGTAVSDVTLSGGATRITEADSQTGKVSFLAKGTSESRLDLSIADGTLTQIRNDTAGYPQGASVVNNGSQQAWALHNCWINASWLFPALSVLASTSDPSVVFLYIGQETRNGISVQHIQSFRYIAAKNPDVTALTQTVSTTDIYLDAASLLPVAFTFNLHPDSDATSNIPIEVDFSKYQAFDKVQVPTHLQQFITGELALDMVVSSASLNTGLPDTLFTISENPE